MITLAVINITTYKFQCFDADHYYGRIIFSQLNIPPKDADQWSMNSLGESQELSYEMTLQDAKELDEKDNYHSYQSAWKGGDKMSTRFNTPEDVVKAGLKVWKEKQNEVGYEFPIINLIEGVKYKNTKILGKNDRN